MKVGVTALGSPSVIVLIQSLWTYRNIELKSALRYDHVQPVANADRATSLSLSSFS